MRSERQKAYGAFLAAIAVAVGAACDGKPATPAAKVPVAGGGPQIEYLPEPERVVLEAESGNVSAPFEVEENEGASGGKCVLLSEVWATHKELNPAFKTREGGEPVSKDGLAENPLGRALVPNGMIELPFNVKKAGEYTLWARAWFSGSCGDSFHFAVDQDPPVDTDGDGTYDERPPYTLDGSTRKVWKWFKRRKVRLALDEGRHVLQVYPREDGIRIDEFFLEEILEGVDPHVPQGMEKPTEVAE